MHNNPLIYVDPSGHEYSRIRDFANDYGGVINVSNGYADVTIGDTTKRFSFNGGSNYQNNNGSIMMERDDFLKQFNMTYEKGEEQQFKITKTQVNTDKGLDYATSIIIGGIGLVPEYGKAFYLAGATFGFYTTFVKEYDIPGNYTVDIYKSLDPNGISYTVVTVGSYSDSNGLYHEYKAVHHYSGMSPLPYNAYIVDPYTRVMNQNNKSQNSNQNLTPQPGPPRPGK